MARIMLITVITVTGYQRYLEVLISAYCSLAIKADLALVRSKFADVRHCSAAPPNLSRI